MNPGETCETCAAYEDSPIVPGGGVCHCHPPTAMFGMTPEGPRPMGSAFTPTLKDAWCGEWKKGNLVKVAKILPIKTDGNGGKKK